MGVAGLCCCCRCCSCVAGAVGAVDAGPANGALMGRVPGVRVCRQRRTLGGLCNRERVRFPFPKHQRILSIENGHAKIPGLERLFQCIASKKLRLQKKNGPTIPKSVILGLSRLYHCGL